MGKDETSKAPDYLYHAPIPGSLWAEDEDSKNWKKLEADLESADSALGAARRERDTLLNDHRERQLGQA